MDKYCAKCDTRKPKSEFGRDKKNKDGLLYTCKSCRLQFKRGYYNKYPEKKQRHLKLRREAWAKRDGRHVNLKRKYGLSEGGFNTLLDSQGGGCAICGATPDRFHVDHCHHSNKVRGILCSGCNTGLGKLGDSVEGLKKALAYLERAEHE